MRDPVEVTIERWTKFPPIWGMPEDQLQIIPHVHNLRNALHRLLHKAALAPSPAETK